MSPKVIELFDKIKQLDIQKLREYWNLADADDAWIESLRQHFLRLGYQLPDMLSNLKENEMVYIKKYSTDKYKFDKYYFIPYIGKISDIDKFIQKYLIYDNTIRNALISHPNNKAGQKQVADYLTGKDHYNKNLKNDYFIFRMIWGKQTSFILEQPQIQIYGIDYEKCATDKFDRPWLGELSDFMSDNEIGVCTIDEVMQQADSFIKDNISENPVFGIDMLNSILNK